MDTKTWCQISSTLQPFILHSMPDGRRRRCFRFNYDPQLCIASINICLKSFFGRLATVPSQVITYHQKMVLSPQKRALIPRMVHSITYFSPKGIIYFQKRGPPKIQTTD